MFKRLLNRKDAPKEGTPPSPEKTTLTSDDAQGFLCPMCMQSFPTGDKLQTHFNSQHVEQPSSPTEAGFLCPDCKAPFSSPEKLEEHFSHHHHHTVPGGASENRSGDVLALRQEVDDLRMSLKEEKWYSSELKKEVDKTPGGAPVVKNESTELEMARHQLRGSEESRTLLSSEVVLLSQQLNVSKSVISTLKNDKKLLEQKAAKLAGDMVSHQARADESESKKLALEDHVSTLKGQVDEKTRYITSLESTLAQRPGADDVIVLKQELISVQTLMDQLTRERESERDKLESTCQQLRGELQRSGNSATEFETRLKNAPKFEEIDSLKQEAVNLASNNKQMDRSLVQKESEIKSLHGQLEKMETLQQQSSDALARKTDESQENKISLSQKEIEINQLKIQIARMQENKKKNHEELQAVKTRLEEKIVSLEERQQILHDAQRQVKSLEDRLAGTASQADSVGKLVQDKDAEIHRLEKQLVQFQGDLKVKDLQLEEKIHTIGGLEKEKEERLKELGVSSSQMTDLKDQLSSVEKQLVEARLALQDQLHSKEQLAQSLQLQLDKANDSLTAKLATVEETSTQLLEVKELHRTEKSANEDLQTKIRELTNDIEEHRRKIIAKDDKILELEQSLLNRKESLSRLENERTDLIGQIEAGEGVATVIGQLRKENESLQQKIIAASDELKSASNEHSSRMETLYRQLHENKNDLQMKEAEIQKLNNSVAEVSDKLAATNIRLSEAASEVKTKNELLVASVAAKNTQRADLENHIETTRTSLDDKTLELGKVKQNLQEAMNDLAIKKGTLTDMEEKVRESRQKISELHRTSSTTETQLAAKTTAYDKLQHTNDVQQKEMQKKLEAMQTLIQEKQAANDKVNYELNQSSARCSHLEGSLGEVSAQLSSVQTKSNAIDEQYKEKLDALMQVEKSKAELEVRLQNKEEKLQQIHSDLEKESKKVENLSATLEEMKNEKRLLEEQISDLKDVRYNISASCTALEVKIADYERNVNQLTSQVKTKEDDLKLEQEKAEREVGCHAQIVQNLKTDIGKQEGDLEKEKGISQEYISKNTDLEILVSSIQTKQSALEESVSKYGLEQQELHAKLASMETEKSLLLEKSGKVESGLNERLHKVAEESEKLKQDCTGYEGQLVKLQQQFRDENEKSTRIEQELRDLKTQKAILKEQCEKLQVNVDTAQENEEATSDSMEEIIELKAAVDRKLLDMVHTQEESNEKETRLEQEKTRLEAVLSGMNLKHQQLEERRESVEKQLEDLRNALAKERQEREEEVAKFQASKQQSATQKLEVEARVSTLEEQITKLENEADEKSKIAEGVQMMLKEEKAGLQNKLTQEVNSREVIEKELTETRNQHEKEMNVLIENMGMLRSDMSSTQDKLAEMQKQSDWLQVEKLEIEAKLDNNNDERRVLLERCLSSEKECERLRESASDYRKKLEHAQGALHELGRENQSLQIKTTKQQQRKWADDSQVPNCRQCQKTFSVTIRKHHCRNCGNIYCNDCSSKVAPLAANKKPVRVCDNCFTEINKN